ncbi:hypothetical protein Q7P37_006615 [Cladosporium fusiforme]
MATLTICADGSIDLGNKVDISFAKAATWEQDGALNERHASALEELDMSNKAYQRWRKSVKLVDSSTVVDVPNSVTASEKDVATVMDALQAMQLDFEEAEESIEESTAGASAEETDSVVRNEETLTHLTNKLTDNIHNLTKILPQAVKDAHEKSAGENHRNQAPDAAAYAEPAMFNAERRNMTKVREKATNADPSAQEAADKKSESGEGRHKYRRNKQSGNARVLKGDQWTGEDGPTGAGHEYEGNVATENARVHYGDRKNMRDFFDE